MFALTYLTNETERLVVDIITQESPIVEDDESVESLGSEDPSGEKLIFACATSYHSLYDAIIYM
jgi:hypothetical protein